MKREKTTARVSSKRPEEEEVSMLNQRKDARIHIRNTMRIGDNIILCYSKIMFFNFYFTQKQPRFMTLCVCIAHSVAHACFLTLGD